jgi:DNA-binding CsgD family transcriptional regulator
MLSLEYGYVRRCLSDLRKIFDVHSTRELVFMLEASFCVDTPAIKLSSRGEDVLRLLMRGFSYKQIGESLGMSISGVRRHREKMLWQNECESVLELIAKYRASHGREAPGNK